MSRPRAWRPVRPVRPGAVVVAAVVLALGALVVIALGGAGAPVSRSQQAHEIAAGLRCPVCRDLSAADSPAPLARQMRVQIRRQLDAGSTPAEIRRGFVASYGPSVLMEPPDDGWGRVAGLAPLAVLTVGLVGGVFILRRGLARPETASVDHAPRQLRDLEDDLAAGRIHGDEHDRLRAALEREAAAARRAPTTPPPAESPVPADASAPAGAGSGRRPLGSVRTRWVIGVATGLGATAGVVLLLVASLGARPPAALPAGGAAAPATPVAQGTGGGEGPTADQAAAVAAAVELVRQHPGRAAAHVGLAHAYTEARQPQLAVVEYLAAARLDPGNPEADTALAMVAFRAGSARRAEALVSRALAHHPRYPEALYTRGLIRAMGLHQQAPAVRDLRAYQRSAPLGSHRTTVATVLALLASGGLK